ETADGQRNAPTHAPLRNAVVRQVGRKEGERWRTTFGGHRERTRERSAAAREGTGAELEAGQGASDRAAGGSLELWRLHERVLPKLRVHMEREAAHNECTDED